MDDDDAAAWAHQQELEERQQLEESWQAMCAACLDEWKAQIEAMTSQRKELNDELECF